MGTIIGLLIASALGFLVGAWVVVLALLDMAKEDPKQFDELMERTGET